MPYIGNNPEQTIRLEAVDQSLDVFNDVDTTSDAPEVGQVLKWNGTNWVPDDDTFGTGGGGLVSGTLQEVTDNGSATTNVISASGFKLNADQLSTVSGSEGDIKKIGGFPYYHDGTAWREFHLFDRPDSSSVVDDEWENVQVRMDFETETPLNYVNGVTASFAQVNAINNNSQDIRVVSSPVKFGTKALKLKTDPDGQDSLYWASYNYSIVNHSISRFDGGKRGGSIDWSGDWTVEFWLNFNDFPQYGTSSEYYGIFSSSSNSVLSYVFGLRVADDQYNNKTFQWINSRNTGNPVKTLFSIAGVSLSTNTWYHVVLQRDASLANITMYFNGDKKTPIIDTNLVPANGVVDPGVSSTRFGSIYDNISDDNRYSCGSDIFIDDLRITQAKRYSDSFAVPTSAYAISAQPPNTVDPNWNDVLLRTTFDVNHNDISQYQNAANVSTSSIQSGIVKYGTGASQVDSYGINYFTTNTSNYTNLLLDEWTIEGWIYCDTLSQTNYVSIFNYGNSQYISRNIDIGIYRDISFTYLYFRNQNNNANTIQLFNSSGYGITSTYFLQKWNHIAITREQPDGKITAYLNGYKISSIYDGDITDWGVGVNYNYIQLGGTQLSSTYRFDGYIDDFRVSKVVRYTDNFTPPTGPLGTTGTVVSQQDLATNGQGVLELGSTPLWNGSSGWTVQKIFDGVYRLDFPGSFGTSTEYQVYTQFMDGPLVPVHVMVTRTTEYIDLTITKISDGTSVDDGYVAVRVTNS